MQPKTNTVDGISKTESALPPQSAVPNLNVDHRSQPKQAPQSLEAEFKNNARSAQKSNDQTTFILITLIVMVLLIGLAYFAYHKSK